MMTSQYRHVYRLMTFCVSTLFVCLFIIASSGSRDEVPSKARINGALLIEDNGLSSHVEDHGFSGHVEDNGFSGHVKDNGFSGHVKDNGLSGHVTPASAHVAVAHTLTAAERPKRSVSTELQPDDRLLTNIEAPSLNNHNTESHPERCFVRHPNESCRASTVIFTHSRIEHFQLRKAIRETWGKKNILRTHNAQLYFVVGAPAGDNTVLKQSLQTEANMHGDILGLHIIDGYENLTAKSLGMMHWIQEHCDSTAQYIVKTDDDTFLNITRLQESTIYSTKQPADRAMLGHAIRGASPRRNRKDRYFTPISLYRKATYPVFLSGSAYVMPRHLVTVILSAAKNTPLFWLEDVFITGILRELLALQFIHSDEFVISKHPHKFRSYNGPFISLHRVSSQEMYTLFDDL